MNSRNRSIVMATLKIKCPLCKELFYSKYNLRRHLGSDHTDTEGNHYIAGMTKLSKVFQGIKNKLK